MDYDECGPQNPKDVQNYVSIILVMTILLVTNGILHAKIQRPENLIGQYAILHHRRLNLMWPNYEGSKEW